MRNNRSDRAREDSGAAGDHPVFSEGEREKGQSRDADYRARTR